MVQDTKLHAIINKHKASETPPYAEKLMSYKYTTLPTLTVALNTRLASLLYHPSICASHVVCAARLPLAVCTMLYWATVLPAAMATQVCAGNSAF